MKLFTKGQWYYETQILMLVFMWKHDLSHNPIGERNASFRWGRLYVWYDSAWLHHGIPGEIRFFFNWTLPFRFRHFFRKANGLLILAVNYPKRLLWLVSTFLHDFAVFFYLWQYGFRISASERSIKTLYKEPKITQDGSNLVIFRFYWHDRIIEDASDIDRITGFEDGVPRFNTVANGAVKGLRKSTKMSRKV